MTFKYFVYISIIDFINLTLGHVFIYFPKIDGSTLIITIIVYIDFILFIAKVKLTISDVPGTNLISGVDVLAD